MNRLRLLSLFLCTIPLLFAGCAYEFPTQPTNEASAIPEDQESRFQNFVVLGGSMTSGIMNGAFYQNGQRGAYPNLVGRHIDSLLQQNSYGIPATQNEQGFNLAASQPGAPKGPFSLSFRTHNSDYPARVTAEGQQLDNFQGDLANVRNFSIPRLRSYHIQNQDSLQQNQFYQRFASQASGQNLVELVVERNPSLVLLSMGIDDIYPYIIHGASGRLDPPDNEIRHNDATPLPLFEQSVQNAVNSLLNNTEADIILTAIINPKEFFYFSSLNWHFGEELDVQYLWRAADYYDGSFNQLVQQHNQNSTYQNRRPPIVFDTNGGGKFRSKVFVDDLLPEAEGDDGTVIPKWRQMEEGEKMLYSAEPMQHESFANGDQTFGTTDPIEDRYVLTAQEEEMIQALLDSYNEVLRSAAQSSDRVLLLDLNAFIQGVQEGAETVDGVSFSVGIEQNSIISADGYYPNQRGHALLSNQLLELFNTSYGTNFKGFDVNNFPSNEYQLGF